MPPMQNGMTNNNGNGMGYVPPFQPRHNINSNNGTLQTMELVVCAWSMRPDNFAYGSHTSLSSRALFDLFQTLPADQAALLSLIECFCFHYRPRHPHQLPISPNASLYYTRLVQSGSPLTTRMAEVVGFRCCGCRHTTQSPGNYIQGSTQLICSEFLSPNSCTKILYSLKDHILGCPLVPNHVKMGIVSLRTQGIAPALEKYVIDWCKCFAELAHKSGYPKISSHSSSPACGTLNNNIRQQQAPPDGNATTATTATTTSRTPPAPTAPVVLSQRIGDSEETEDSLYEELNEAVTGALTKNNFGLENSDCRTLFDDLTELPMKESSIVSPMLEMLLQSFCVVHRVESSSWSGPLLDDSQQQSSEAMDIEDRSPGERDPEPEKSDLNQSASAPATVQPSVEDLSQPASEPTPAQPSIDNLLQPVSEPNLTQPRIDSQLQPTSNQTPAQPGIESLLYPASDPKPVQRGKPAQPGIESLSYPASDPKPAQLGVKDSMQPAFGPKPVSQQKPEEQLKPGIYFECAYCECLSKPFCLSTGSASELASFFKTRGLRHLCEDCEGVPNYFQEDLINMTALTNGVSQADASVVKDNFDAWKSKLIGKPFQQCKNSFTKEQRLTSYWRPLTWRFLEKVGASAISDKNASTKEGDRCLLLPRDAKRKVPFAQHENDVLIGWNGAHVGNRRYMALLNECRTIFFEKGVSGMQKKIIACTILSQVEKRGGQFYSVNSNYETVPPTLIDREKACALTIKMLELGSFILLKPSSNAKTGRGSHVLDWEYAPQRDIFGTKVFFNKRFKMPEPFEKGEA